MISSPGDKKMESATACAARREATGVVETYLQSISGERTPPPSEHKPVQCDRQEQFRCNHRPALEAYCRPRIIAKVIDLQHSGIHPASDLRQ